MEECKDIDEFLLEIENKYSFSSNSNAELEQQLFILSQECSTLGLPEIDLKQSLPGLLLSLVNNTFLLIQSHRKLLSQTTEMNISQRSMNIKTDNLQKNIMNLKTKLKAAEDQNLKLENKLLKLDSECEELNKKKLMHNKETEKLKRFFASKQNQLIHHIKNLENENHYLKEVCGKDIDKHFSKDDKFLRILKMYKQKEEVYKESLQKLEDNNAEIMNEILNLKNELALAYCKKDSIIEG